MSADERAEADNLTVDKLRATLRQFEGMVRRIKADDVLDGVCICSNCFGDRGLLAWRSSVARRRCLADPNLLTDLGPPVGRHLQ